MIIEEDEGMRSLPAEAGGGRRREQSMNLVGSRVLRNKRLQTPSGPEGSSGSNPLCVPQGSLAINKLFFLLWKRILLEDVDFKEYFRRSGGEGSIIMDRKISIKLLTFCIHVPSTHRF
jgi:hypothetical protein